MNAVTPDFFTTVGTRILRGRQFTDADGAAAPRVVIIGARLARALWKDADPIGKCVKVGRRRSLDREPCTTVVGVAEDARRLAIDDAAMQYYVPLSQEIVLGRTLLVRASGDPGRVIAPLRRQLATVSPNLPFVEIRTLESLVEPHRQSWRLGAVVFTIFGAVAMMIASFGLYAMIAYEVARRRREFGIRLALGAARSHVVGLVVSDGLSLVGAGLAVGCLLALVAGARIQSLLYDVSARDPLVFTVVIVVLLATAVVACAFPSYRAGRINPSRTLRSE